MSTAEPYESLPLGRIPLRKGTIPIPTELLQAHEEGKVIFFCGAGVSCKAGLRDANELMSCVIGSQGGDCVGKDLEQKYERIERDERSAGRQCGGDHAVCECVRCRVAKQLGPEPNANLQSHCALLTLGGLRPTSSIGATHAVPPPYRLVTTNFDLCFLEAEKQLGGTCRSFIAPLLPQPKPNSFAGVVYLHGRIAAGDSCDRDGGRTLVLTSGDYGRAYITERWASRFVSELLRRFTVCFVGYSFQDTVMRYLRDAASTEVGTDGGFKQAYIFVPAPEVGDHSASAITPITFENKSGDYAELHDTLKLWAERSSQGRYGRPVIIDELAGSTPDTALPTDEGRLKWALGAKETAEALARSVSTADGDGAGTLAVSWIRVIAGWHDGEQGFFAPRLPESARVKNDTYPGLAKWFAAQAHFPEAIHWFCESRGPIDTRLREAIESADWFVKHREGIQTGHGAAARFWHLAVGGRSERDSPTVLASVEPRERAGPSHSGWLWDRRLEPRIHLPAGASDALRRQDHLADLKSWVVVLADSALAEYFREALRVTDLGVNRIPKFTVALANRLLALIDDAVALWSEIGAAPWQISGWLDELDSDSPALRDASEWLILPLLLDYMLERASSAPAEAKRCKGWIRSALPVKQSWVRDWLLLRACRFPALVGDQDFVRWLGGVIKRDEKRYVLVRQISNSISDAKRRDMRGRNAESLKYLEVCSDLTQLGLPSGWKIAVPHFVSVDTVTDWMRSVAAGKGTDEVLRVVAENVGIIVDAVCALAEMEDHEVLGRLDLILESLSTTTLDGDQSARIVSALQVLPAEVLARLAPGAAVLLSKIAKEVAAVAEPVSGVLLKILRLARDTDVPKQDFLFFAINQAAGVAADARLRLWLRTAQDGLKSMPNDLKEVLQSTLGDEGRLSATVILGGYVNHCYVADHGWTDATLLKAMRHSENGFCARALWIGYVRSGRLYAPVLEELAPVLPEAREWVSSDPEAARRFAQMCTLAAADSVCKLSDDGWRGLFEGFSDDQLVASAFQLARIVEAAGDRAPALWAQDGAARRVLSLWPERKIAETYKAGAIAMALTKPILEQPATLVDAVPLIESRLCPLPRYGVRIDEGLLSWVRGEQATKSSLEALKKLLDCIFSENPAERPMGWKELLDAVHARLTQM